MIFSDLIWQSQVGDNFLSVSWIRSNITTVLATLLACLVAFCSWAPLRTWRQERARRIKCAELLPGPPTYPIIGNAHLFLVSLDDFLFSICKIIDQYSSPSRFWMGPKLVVALGRPEDCEVILKSPNATVKDYVMSMWKPFVGEGLVTSSGDLHRYWRKAVLPMLNKKALDSFVEYFNKHAKICAHQLEKNVGKGEFDIMPYVVECSTNVMFETILGTSVDLQKDNMKDFICWQEKMYYFVYDRMVHFWLQPKWLYSWTSRSKQQDAGVKVIHEFTEKIIEKKTQECDEIQKGAVVQERPRYMLVEQILDWARKENIRDKNILRDNLFTLYTAALDTIKEIVSFSLIMMGIHQEIQEKVRAEIESVVGEGDVEAEHLQDLKYLEMVIKETLRLFPPGPILMRVLTADVELETCTLAKGTSVSICSFYMHRNPKYWTNPLEFDPERFTPENIQKRHAYVFLPFSGGVRGCIGQKYAPMCLKTILAHLVRKYRFFSSRGMEDIKLKSDIATRSAVGYNVSIELA